MFSCSKNNIIQNPPIGTSSEHMVTHHSHASRAMRSSGPRPSLNLDPAKRVDTAEQWKYSLLATSAEALRGLGISERREHHDPIDVWANKNLEKLLMRLFNQILSFALWTLKDRSLWLWWLSWFKRHGFPESILSLLVDQGIHTYHSNWNMQIINISETLVSVEVYMSSCFYIYIYIMCLTQWNIRHHKPKKSASIPGEFPQRPGSAIWFGVRTDSHHPWWSPISLQYPGCMTPSLCIYIYYIYI